MLGRSDKRSSGSRLAENFDLLIWKTAEGYRARVRDPESGEAYTDFSRPFPEEDLAGILRDAGACRDLKSARKTSVSARDLGGSLFNAIFSDELLVSWRRCLERAGRRGLRLRLHLNSPDLWDWPWELLRDPKLGFLASLPETPVVRYIELSEPIPPLQARPPIRVLAISACPAGFSRLSIQEELADLEGALDKLREAERVELARLENATREALLHKLQERTYHVLHFVGHGAFEAGRGGGMVVLQDKDGKADPIGAEELNVLLKAHLEIRLVVLNICQGARGGDSDPFAGLAQSLVKGRVPAVVAMRSSVTDRAATDFSRAFYTSLSRREPVDLAVSRGRHAMFRQDSSEWASPVLAMRSPNGQLFALFWWEVLADRALELGSTWRRWLVAFLLLMILLAVIRPWVKHWLDPNLISVFFNPPECPSPQGLSIAFVKVNPDPPLRPFCIGRYEVTQRIWKDVTGHHPPTRRRGNALPVVRVSWNDTVGFFAALKRREPGGELRLPTGAEWTYAAQAGEASPPQASAKTANCENREADDGYEGAAPVGSYSPTELGLYDMLGNATEWVSDDDGSGKRIRRGGGFKNALKNCSFTFPGRSKPDARPEDAGFRIVREIVKNQGPKGPQERKGRQGPP
jgi:hypothetical protein